MIEVVYLLRKDKKDLLDIYIDESRTIQEETRRSIIDASIHFHTEKSIHSFQSPASVEPNVPKHHHSHQVLSEQ
jgi:hypothetical protein